MKRETNACCAALLLCGESPDAASPARAQSLFRDALKSGDLSIFDGFQYTFQDVIPAIAAIETSSVFTGTAKMTFTVHNPEYEFDGFYMDGKGDTEFHEDSVDYEDLREDLNTNTYAEYEKMFATGINRMQAMDVLTLSTPVQVSLTGTLMDFYRLWKTCAGAKACRHPSTMRAAQSIWAELSVSDRVFTEVAREVAP